MRTLLVATISTLALLAGQALAQSAGTTSPPTDQSAQQAPSSGVSDATQLQASDLLGKKVKLQGTDSAVGEITDVVVVDGQPQQAIIDMGPARDKSVAVSLANLDPSGEDFILLMTEQELAGVPDYEPDGATPSLPGQQPESPGAQTPQSQSR